MKKNIFHKNQQSPMHKKFLNLQNNFIDENIFIISSNEKKKKKKKTK